MKLKMYAKTTSVAQETNRNQEVAQKVGIILPSTHTALFQSVYAPIEVANLNGIRLARQAVETGIQGLIGSQVNLEHFGYGWIVGIILDAWVNDQEEIEIVYSDCDLNRDEMIDVIDLGIWATCQGDYGKQTDSECDISNDGVYDVIDLGLWATCY